MENLWLAILLYSVGLGLVLHFRPALMFNQNGSWKEFGYQRDSRHTLFPVWLFAVTWAFVSYAIAAVIVALTSSGGAGAGIGAAAATAATWVSSSRDESEAEIDVEEEEDEEEETIAIPVSKMKKRSSSVKASTPGKSKPRPGYYVIDPAQAESGLRKYVYYGSTPPPADDA